MTERPTDIYNVRCSYCKHDYNVVFKSINLICPECDCLLGFHDKECGNLLNRGSLITLPKGVKYHSTKDGQKHVSQRNNEKTVSHCFGGSMNWLYEEISGKNILMIHSNPSVVWAGSGGYWCEADINKIIIKMRHN